MAKIIETILTVKLSQLVKDDSDPIDTDSYKDLLPTIEQVVQELVSENIVVEASIQ